MQNLVTAVAWFVTMLLLVPLLIMFGIKTFRLLLGGIFLHFASQSMIVLLLGVGATVDTIVRFVPTTPDYREFLRGMIPESLTTSDYVLAAVTFLVSYLLAFILLCPWSIVSTLGGDSNKH